MFRQPNQRHAKRLLIGAVLIFVQLATASETNSSWSTRVWGSDDGLPNNTVNALAQTSDGYLYIATPTRLARFDGISFEEVSYKSFAGSSNPKIRALLTDRRGGLCVAMDDALAVLDPGSRRIMTNGLEGISPQGVVEDGDGAFWIVYEKNKVCRIKDGRVKRFGQDDGLDTNYICTLAVDTRGRLWFGQSHAVGIFRNEKFETLVRAPFTATRICAAGDGGIWISSNAQLLKYHEGGQLEDHGRLKVDPPYRTPIVLLESRDGAVWMGTSDHGLFCYDAAGFQAVPTSHSDVLAFLEDHEGNLWVGTDGGGLNRLKTRAVELLQGQAELPFEAVQSICEDTNGDLWVAAGNGVLARRTGSSWQNISSDAIWPGGSANCVAAAPDGSVWIGTGSSGLRRWHAGVIDSWAPSADGLASRSIRALMVARNGDLWIGEQGPGPLQCLHQGQFRTIPLPRDTRLIRGMAEDLNGNIWIGTAGSGTLFCVSNDIATDCTSLTLSEPRSIRCLQTTPDGSLWIGYAGSGVGRLKNGRFVQARTADGLYDNSISQILYDGRGWMWFGAEHGIFKVREQDFEAFAENRVTQIHSIHYGRDDGAPSLQANVGNCPSAMRTQDGRLWMPMRSGLAVVDPTALHENLEPPPVLLKRVIVDDRVLAIDSDADPVHANEEFVATPLKIAPDHRRLEFQFTALTFRDPENVRFRYRLEGFDNGWMDAGTQRGVTYSRLPAGEYRFDVKACNSDGVWNDRGVALALTVTPFLWQTWWFRLTAVAVFAFGIGATVRYLSTRRLRSRVQALERQAALDRERARIARDIHDDLGASLTEMTLLAGLASRKESTPEQVGEHVQQLSTTVRQVTDSLDEIVWAVNPRNDTLPHMVNYLGKFALNFVRTAGIRCSVDLPDQPPPLTLSAEVRHNLFLVAKEALNNSVRHANATEITFTMALVDGSLKIIVDDNGRGLAGAANGDDADGLRNMRERMKNIGGIFEIEPKAGAGTRVVLVYPCLHPDETHGKP